MIKFEGGEPLKPLSKQIAPSKPKSFINPSLVSFRPDGHGLGLLPAAPETKFSWGIVKEIILRVQKGEFLTDICDIKRNPHLVSFSTFTLWMEKKPKISNWLERSRKMAANVLAEKSVSLFFDEPPTETLVTKNGSIDRISMSGVQRERYTSQALMALASKWNPDTYGDKLSVQNTFDLSVVLNAAQPTKMLKKLKQLPSEPPKV